MKDKLKNLFAYFKNQSAKSKIFIIISTITILIVFYLTIGLFVGALIEPVFNTLKNSDDGFFYYGLIFPFGRTITIVCTVCCMVLILTLVQKHNFINRVISTDERGVHFLEKGTVGTSKWLDKKEARNHYTIENIKNTTTTVYGQIGSGGKEVVGYKKPEKGGTGDQNLLLIGSPGTGKSYSYVRTEIIQSILRGDSVVCTDPSGELYTSLNQFARDKGYDVKVLNLAEPSYSDFWNCISETINPETERLDGTRLNEFVEIFMKNSSASDGKEDQFWAGAASNLLKASIGYASWLREYSIWTDLSNLYRHYFGNELSLDDKYDQMCSFKTIKDDIRKKIVEQGKDIFELEENFNAIYESASPFTIKEVFHVLMNFLVIDEKEGFTSMPKMHPGRIAYDIFSTNANANVQSSALQGIQLRMQLFTDDKLMSVLSNDGIHISSINTKPSVYFVIISDKSVATKPIASLFFSFFFKDSQDNWDKNQHLADEEGKPNPCLHTTVMLDEFFSLGVIGGNPDVFAVVMSNSRKRQLHINIVVQSYKQIAALYGENNAMTIQTCCDTILFLGCNDPQTAEFISKFVSGEATVLNERHSESQNMWSAYESQFNPLQITSTRRYLLTVDEVRRWHNKVLLAKRSAHPMELNPFGWTEHPCYKNGEIKPMSLYKTIKPVEERTKVIKELKELRNETITKRRVSWNYSNSKAAHVSEAAGSDENEKNVSAKHPCDTRKKNNKLQDELLKG